MASATRPTVLPQQPSNMNRIDIEQTALRSRMLGGIRSSDEGAEVELAGWVHRRRDLGALIFLDLRDRSGLIQVSFGPDWTEATSLGLSHQLGAEDVVAIVGSVTVRPSENWNTEIPTGEVEVRATSLRRLTDADTPAIPVYRGSEDELPSEELRLKHRVLDLRRTELQANLQLRHRLILACRNYLDGLGFMEVETPILTKPTPEGARDYLVPSRLHHGEFYALPQSPQIYKQLCMAAGFDRYFQIARCFRDEDLRADRQPEFTQIDVEASFVDSDDILGWMEGLMVALAAEAPRIEAPSPFIRMTHAEALEQYGTDRPEISATDWRSRIGRQLLCGSTRRCSPPRSAREGEYVDSCSREGRPSLENRSRPSKVSRRPRVHLGFFGPNARTTVGPARSRDSWTRRRIASWERSRATSCWSLREASA